MTGRTRWTEVRDARLATEADRERYDAARQRLDADLASHARTLQELRRARALTQTQLAKSLAVSQAQVSRIETQTDLYLSTLRSYVEAMGGELEIRVVFGDGAWAEVDLAERSRAVNVLRDRVPRRSASGSPEAAAPGEPRVTVVRVHGTRGEGAGAVRHVVPRPDGWAVTRDAGRKATYVLASKREAVLRAKEIVSRNGGGEVRVHARGRAAG